MLIISKLILLGYFASALFQFKTVGSTLALLTSISVGLYLYLLNGKKPTGHSILKKTKIYTHTLFPCGLYFFQPNLSIVSYGIIVIATILAITATLDLNRFFHIEPFQAQQIKQDGIYGIVRHPIYLSTNLVILAILLSISSSEALLGILFYSVYFVLTIQRIEIEENFLKTENQYRIYSEKVQYRLFPYLY